MPRNLNIKQGKTYSHPVSLVDENGVGEDWSAYTFTSAIKTTAGGAIATFTIDQTDKANGNIILQLSASTTGGIDEGDYEWDLKATAGSTVDYPLEGRVRVRKRVTT